MKAISLFLLYSVLGSYIILVLWHSFRTGIASVRKAQFSRKEKPEAFWLIVIVQSILLAGVGVLAILQLLSVLRK